MNRYSTSSRSYAMKDVEAWTNRVMLSLEGEQNSSMNGVPIKIIFKSAVYESFAAKWQV